MPIFLFGLRMFALKMTELKEMHKKSKVGLPKMSLEH